MTPQERQILDEAEQQAFETAQAYNESRTRGIQPEPAVEETETTLEGQLFGLDFGIDPTAEVLPGASIPVEVTGGCCVGSSCSIQTESDCTGMGGTYQGDDTTCSPNPCVCSPCAARMTAVFSGVSGAGCLMDYSWPVGITNSVSLGDSVYIWQAYCDSGPAPNEIACLDGINSISVTVGCDPSDGWAITVTNSGITIFEATGDGSIPLSTPISPNVTGDGTVTMTCSGAWGVCCACFDGSGTDCVCFGCTNPAGANSHICGMGQDQCEILVAGFSGIDHVIWQGDPSSCTPQPCAGTSPDC